MADVKTIDQRLREAAVNTARKEMEQAIHKLASLRLGSTPFGWIPVPMHGGVTPDLSTVLAQAADRYITKHADELGNVAVKAFMDKVAELSMEVGELRNMVEDLPRGDS